MQDNHFGNLGFYSLGLLYCVFGITSFFSAVVVNKLGTKCSLLIGAFCYCLYVACFILPAFRSENLDSDLFLLNKTFIWIVVLLCAAINGFGAGILWVAQGKYVS
mmetsp:Transcript_19652/g.14105  ORF Transcript_19652/g.14105 Transcript_19652/m.14105 type:complete len:105 (+) Transcript_19652:134-448(+)